MDDKCRYQSASRKDLVKSHRTGAMLLKKLFQYANKQLSAEPLVLNVLNASSNLSSMFMHLLHWLVIFTWFLLGSCIIITISSILSNSSENTLPSEDCKIELLHESCSKKELYLELLHGLSYQRHPSFTPNTISVTHNWVDNCRSIGENVSGILPLPPKLPIFISSWLGSFLIYLFMLFIHNVFCPYVAIFLQKYEPDMNLVLIEIRSFQQPVCYLGGLDPKSFRISLPFNMVTNDPRFVSRIWGCYCFGSLWSSNRRRQWWKIGFFRLLFRCFNFVSRSFLLVRSAAGFDVISYIDLSILINNCN